MAWFWCKFMELRKNKKKVRKIKIVEGKEKSKENWSLEFILLAGCSFSPVYAAVTVTVVSCFLQSVSLTCTHLYRRRLHIPYCSYCKRGMHASLNFFFLFLSITNVRSSWRVLQFLWFFFFYFYKKNSFFLCIFFSSFLHLLGVVVVSLVWLRKPFNKLD